MKFCDNTENSCPFNKPKKCQDGLCVESLEKCSDDIKCSSETDTLCSDGSCVTDEKECPNA